LQWKNRCGLVLKVASDLQNCFYREGGDYSKWDNSMVGLLDFTLGIVSGVVVSFLGYYLTEAFRERKRHVRVAKAFIRELTMIKDDINLGTPYKSAIVGTPVFSKLITELPLLEEMTAEELLNTYSDIKFYLRPRGTLTTDDSKELVEAIETTIKFLRKEVEHKPKHCNAQSIDR
jgi:hypothetical protein